MPRKGFTSITLSEELVERVRRIVRSPLGENYRGVAAFIAEAVREKLEEKGEVPIVSVEEIPLGEARSRITQYLKDHPGVHYPSDIAFKLGLDLELVFEVVKALTIEGMVEEVEKPRKVIVR